MRALGRVWRRRGGFILDVLPPLLYTAVLFYFGLVPLKSLPGPDFDMADKVWHAAAFGGMAGLGSRALAYFGRAPRLAARDAALGAIAAGGLLELLQSLTTYRSADWADFLADSLGVLLAYGILRWLCGSAEPQGVAD